MALTVTGIAITDVPQTDPASATAEQVAILNGMLAFFKSSPAGTPMPPLTYADVGVAASNVMSALVGQKIWAAFYGKKVVEGTDYVPWQLLEMLRHAVSAAAMFRNSAGKLAVDADTAKAADEILRGARKRALDNSYCPW